MESDLWLLAMGAAVFSVYFVSLAPSIAGGDSGELVAEGCSLGSAHPPGYPLFTIMVYVLKRIVDPIGIEVAYAVNLSSAILTTGAAVAMGKVVMNSGRKRAALPGAVLAMGLFSFSPLIWQYAVTAEVFPLNTFLMALLVYLVTKYEKDMKEFVMCSGAFLCGLALSNQHTAVLYEAPLVLWMLIMHKTTIIARPSLLGIYACLFLCGIALYAYLPISSAIVDSSGGWGDVSSISGLVHHILRRDYGTFQLYSGKAGKQTEGMAERTLAYVEDLYSTQAMYIGPILALIGSIYWIKCEILTEGTSEDLAVDNSSTRLKRGQAVKNAPTYIRDIKKTVNSRDLNIYTPLVIAVTQIFYFAVFHSLSNLPLSDNLLYGIHQRFW